MSSKDSQSFCMRPMDPEDLPTVALWFEHLADLSLFDRSSPVPVNKSIIKADWKAMLTAPEPRKGYWFTIDNAEGEILGIAGIENINYVHGDCVLGIYMADLGRRKGLATRAGGLLLDLAFKQLRLNRVTSYYRSDNEASRKLTIAAGFTEEGIIRQGWFAQGQHLDIILVGLLSSEWEQSQQKFEEKVDTSIELKFGRSS